MAGADRENWVVIYETRSASDADLVRTTLEVAGYRVSIEGGGSPHTFSPSYDTPGSLTIAVPTEDADDAREFLRQKTSLLPRDDAAPTLDAANATQPESLADATGNPGPAPSARGRGVQVLWHPDARRRRTRIGQPYD